MAAHRITGSEETPYGDLYIPRHRYGDHNGTLELLELRQQEKLELRAQMGWPHY